MDHIRYSRMEDGQLMRSLHSMQRDGHAFRSTQVSYYDDAGNLVRQTRRTNGGAHEVIQHESIHTVIVFFHGL